MARTSASSGMAGNLSRSSSTSSLSSVGGEWECPVGGCMYTAASVNTLMRHWDRVHERASRQFLCPLQGPDCDYCTANLSNLRRHLTLMHKDQMPDKKAAAEACRPEVLICKEVPNAKYEAPGFAAPPISVSRYHLTVGLTRLQGQNPAETSQAGLLRDALLGAEAPSNPSSVRAGASASAAKSSAAQVEDVREVEVEETAEQDAPDEVTVEGANDVEAFVLVKGPGAPVASVTAIDPAAIAPLLEQHPVSTLPRHIAPCFTSQDCLLQVQIWSDMHRMAMLEETRRRGADDQVTRLNQALRQSRERELQMRAQMAAVQRVFEEGTKDG